jgi:hypothetical protein
MQQNRRHTCSKMTIPISQTTPKNNIHVCRQSWLLLTNTSMHWAASYRKNPCTHWTTCSRVSRRHATDLDKQTCYGLRQANMLQIETSKTIDKTLNSYAVRQPCSPWMERRGPAGGRAQSHKWRSARRASDGVVGSSGGGGGRWTASRVDRYSRSRDVMGWN